MSDTLSGKREIRIDGFVARLQPSGDVREALYEIECPCKPRCSLILEMRMPHPAIAAWAADEIATRMQSLIDLHNERMKGKTDATRSR